METKMEQRSVTNSGNRKWLCVAKVGETPGDEAANTGWSQLRKKLMCHVKEIYIEKLRTLRL